MKVLLFLLALFVTILVHEFGHFIVAKLLRFKVEEFSIGMGPKIAQKRFGSTIYTIRALPLGGYVLFQDKEDKIEDTTTERFMEDIYWGRLPVIAAGVIFNFLLIFCLLVLYALFNHVNLPDATNFALTTIIEFFKVTLGAMTDINNFSSILGGAYQAQNTNISDMNFFMLGIIFSLNISVIVFNALPIPILDGGQFILMLIESILKKKIPQKVRFSINLVCWSLIISFSSWLLVKDFINIVF